jgi:Lipoprotein LpqB beta-propeller domain
VGRRRATGLSATRLSAARLSATRLSAARLMSARLMSARLTAARLTAAGVVVTLSLAGCGVSGTGPTDEGNAAVIEVPATDAERKNPPSPDAASSAEGLVDDYLKAAVGGGKPAIDQVKAFLNGHALESWVNPVSPENPQLTVIRVVRGPITGAATGSRTPVTVEYQVVGILSDQGRIDNLADLATRTMTFWVVPDKDDRRSLRVDQIDDAPPGLLLSDTALTEYYRIQPIYFWDQNYSALVPDVRYVPLTTLPDVRAGQLVQWLVAGWSPWVTNAQGLPPGIAPDRVVSENGTLVVKLTAETALDEESLRRLYFQLQWTLRTPTSTPTMKLRIDDKDVTVPVGTDDYLRYNLSYGFRDPAQRYDIIDGKVVQIPPAATPSGALAAAENQNVVYAAVTRGGAAAAFVRLDQGRRYLQIVNENAVITTKVPAATSMGRPAFIPNSPDSLMKDSLMIASGGRLYAVSGIDGAAADVTRVNGVTAVSVSPDGRRIAFVASKQVYVASLILANNAITLGPFRPVLSGQIEATSVAWTSESWLDVAGGAIGGGPALWRVAADSVVAQNLSDKLAGVTVSELLAYPQWPGRTNTDVLLTTTDRVVYTFFSNLTPAGDVKAPFFGT